MRPGWSVMVDGRVLRGPRRTAIVARFFARELSTLRPGAAVACVVLGQPETLRRFEGGKDLRG